MFCDQCNKKPATVHLSKIVNGEKNNINLCEECAGDYQKFAIFDGSFSLPKLLAGIMEQGDWKRTADYVGRPIKCEKCGLTYQQFSQAGKLGCSECYSAFANHLKPLLRRIHGSIYHQGKVPRKIGSSLGIKRDIDKLRSELQMLVHQEEFEKAAVVRDEIKKLEKKLAEEEG